MHTLAEQKEAEASRTGSQKQMLWSVETEITERVIPAFRNGSRC